MTSFLRTQEYHFELPPSLIAQRPSTQRGHSRCLFVDGSGQTNISSFSKIVDYFKGDEVLVLNDTRVIPARLHGRKTTGGHIEVFFLELLEINQNTIHFKAMTRGKLKVTQEVHLPHGAIATLLARDDHGHATMSIRWENQQTADPGIFWEWLEQVGEIPLPPYIQRQADQEDEQRYQTVYAQTPGAVAAPTAGLHFTPEILQALEAKGVEIAYVTLHVGAGTFLPVKTEDLSDHVMHSERYSVPSRTQELIQSKRPMIAVGTTVVRALESFAKDPLADRTDIFIYPGYEFKVIDGLLSNFHLPQSTLLMLVSAFAGHQATMQAYQIAVEAQLRFYSYGDASLWVRPHGAWDR